MANKLTPIIVIPARLAATRLPGKPLAEISGKPMIIHVAERAKKSGLGPVLIAAGDKQIADLTIKAGYETVLTDPDIPSGTDRVFAAIKKYDPKKKYDVVINLQGDLPTIDPKIISEILIPFKEKNFSISTLIAEIDNQPDRFNPNVVKAVVSFISKNIAKALYFTRSTAPSGEGALYHHIGIYAFRRAALEKFTKLSPSPLEKREKLEQLRALENDMNIAAVLVNTVPVGVDTLEDLEKVRKIIGG